jgi:hypothetical protein
VAEKMPIAFAALALVFVPAAAAGNGGGSKPSSSSLTLVMVADANGNGLPNWNDRVTFNVSTTATSEPHVSLKCFQSGSLVYTTQTGYYASYPWPWTQIMTLSSPAWSGGSADCTAALYSFKGGKTLTLRTLNFHVDA